MLILEWLFAFAQYTLYKNASEFVELVDDKIHCCNKMANMRMSLYSSKLKKRAHCEKKVVYTVVSFVAIDTTIPTSSQAKALWD